MYRHSERKDLMRNLFFITLLGFTRYWDYKPTNAIHANFPGVYTNDKILSSNTINKIHLKCDVIDGSVQDGVRQPFLFSFVLINHPDTSIL